MIENLLVTAIALFAGWLTLKINNKPVKPASSKEIGICLLTNGINTLITFAGFKLWQYGYITFDLDISWGIIGHVLVLFIAMDLAMYILHYDIHHSAIYNSVHKFHHHYHDPIPIALFVLHPLETLSFGTLWLVLISAYQLLGYCYLFNLKCGIWYSRPFGYRTYISQNKKQYCF